MSDKLVTIIINTRKVQVEKGKIGFDAIVRLAFDPVPVGNDVQFLITYHRGHGNAEGKLLPGQTVEVVENMVFDVSTTYKS